MVLFSDSGFKATYYTSEIICRDNITFLKTRKITSNNSSIFPFTHVEIVNAKTIFDILHGSENTTFVYILCTEWFSL